jgi:hypothetical protein
MSVATPDGEEHEQYGSQQFCEHLARHGIPSRPGLAVLDGSRATLSTGRGETGDASGSNEAGKT